METQTAPKDLRRVRGIKREIWEAVSQDTLRASEFRVVLVSRAHVLLADALPSLQLSLLGP